MTIKLTNTTPANPVSTQGFQRFRRAGEALHSRGLGLSTLLVAIRLSALYSNIYLATQAQLKISARLLKFNNFESSNI